MLCTMWRDDETLRPKRSVWRWIIVATMVVLHAAFPANADPIQIGSISFSDELGGFELIAVTGSGSEDDPFILFQRMRHNGPAILVVRLEDATADGGMTGQINSFFRSALTAIIINDGNLPWIGFDFELQQERDQPSVYGDGLSFDQPQTFKSRAMQSNRFSELTNAAEPFDRLRFRGGGVDPGADAEFSINLLDVSPISRFYIVQQPRVPLT